MNFTQFLTEAKKEGAENKYGSVFGLTKNEQEKFKKICIFEMLRILKK